MRTNPEFDYLPESQLANLIRNICHGTILSRSPLSGLQSTERLDICVAAKKHVQGTQPVLREREVEEAKIFVFMYALKRGKIPAIRCPSSPTMYVYYEIERDDYELQVAVVDEVEENLVDLPSSSRNGPTNVSSQSSSRNSVPNVSSQSSSYKTPSSSLTESPRRQK